MDRQCQGIIEGEDSALDPSEEEAVYFEAFGLTAREAEKLEANGIKPKPVLTWEDVCEMRWVETYVYADNPPWSVDDDIQAHEQYWEKVHSLLAEDESSM